MQIALLLLGIVSGALAQGSSASVGGSASGSAAASGSASASASASSSAPSSTALVSALQNNQNTATLAQVVANSNPALGLLKLLESPTANLTILAPPSAALQAAAGNALVNSVSVNISSGSGNSTVSFLDALLAYHVINGTYDAATIISALQSNPNGLSVPTNLMGASVEVYGSLASSSSSSGSSASASASASASSSSSSSSGNSYIFVNNAVVIEGNAIQVGGTSDAPGIKVVHLISNILNPLFPLVGTVELPSGGQVIEPSFVAAASTITPSAVPFSIGSATATSSAAASSGSASVGAASASAAPSSSAMRLARWA